MMASATARVACAGDPWATRIARSTAGGLLRGRCRSETYIVGGTPSRGDRYSASRTIPTISRAGDSSPGDEISRIVFPIGLVPPKYFLTNVSLTRVTFGEAIVSWTVKSRPARIGVP